MLLEISGETTQTFNLKHHNSLKLLVVTNLGDKSLGSIAEIRIHSTSD